MDTRIEELAAIILERCDEYKNAANNAPRKSHYSDAEQDKYRAYKAIGQHALEMLCEIQDYMNKHPS